MTMTTETKPRPLADLVHDDFDSLITKYGWNAVTEAIVAVTRKEWFEASDIRRHAVDDPDSEHLHDEDLACHSVFITAEQLEARVHHAELVRDQRKRTR